MIALYHAYRIPVLLGCFGIGFVIGAGSALLKNALRPGETQVVYCYPGSTETLCRSIPTPPSAPERPLAARAK
jgi:hypothetical protein